jgi:hypothetical protein
VEKRVGRIDAQVKEKLSKRELEAARRGRKIAEVWQPDEGIRRGRHLQVDVDVDVEGAVRACRKRRTS